MVWCFSASDNRIVMSLSFTTFGRHTSFDCKTYATFTALITVATPEKGVSSSNFGKLAFICWPCFTQGCHLNVIPSEFSCNKSCSFFRSAGFHVVHKCEHIPCANGEWNHRPKKFRTFFLCFDNRLGSLPAMVSRSGLG